MNHNSGVISSTEPSSSEKVTLLWRHDITLIPLSDKSAARCDVNNIAFIITKN